MDSSRAPLSPEDLELVRGAQRLARSEGKDWEAMSKDERREFVVRAKADK